LGYGPRPARWPTLTATCTLATRAWLRLGLRRRCSREVRRRGRDRIRHDGRWRRSRSSMRASSLPTRRVGQETPPPLVLVNRRERRGGGARLAPVSAGCAPTLASAALEAATFAPKLAAAFSPSSRARRTTTSSAWARSALLAIANGARACTSIGRRRDRSGRGSCDPCAPSSRSGALLHHDTRHLPQRDVASVCDRRPPRRCVRARPRPGPRARRSPPRGRRRHCAVAAGPRPSSPASARSARTSSSPIGAAVMLAAALAVAAGPRAPRLPVSLFRCATTRRRADPSPSENLSLLPVTSRLMPLMFFNLHDTNECGRVCSRMACRSWWPHLLHV
jgi:hypothetical protein